jgi:scytalone dehydratase
MPLDEYIDMARATTFLGDPCTLTQHLVGMSHYERHSDTEVEGRHQVRAAHQVYTGTDLKEVRLVGTAIASNVHWYQKVDGVWKFAGLRPTVLWSEGDFAKVWDRGEGGSFWQ